MLDSKENVLLKPETELFYPKGIICPEGIWAFQAALLLSKKDRSETNDNPKKVEEVVENFLCFLIDMPQLEVFTIDCDSGEKTSLDRTYLRGRSIRKELYKDILSPESPEDYAKGRHIFVNKSQFFNFMNGKVISGSTEIEEKPLGTRERETLLKIIIGMAKDAYGYDPNASRSPFPKELEGILDELNISVSDDTIRVKLKEASELLPTVEDDR